MTESGGGAAPLGRALAARRRLAQTFREEYARVLSLLVAELRDFDLGEDALGDAMAEAAQRWPRGGQPREPAGWLLAVARRRAVDRLRRVGTERRKAPLLIVPEAHEPHEPVHESIGDERLRLLFTACHPALSREAQVALTLRVVGGLTTPEIARAFLVPDATMGQRISRAKAKIRNAGIPYAVPESDEMPARIAGVRSVIYLIFTEGHTASAGPALQRVELQHEAIRLATLAYRGMPDERENAGLLALLLLTAARSSARWRRGRPVPLAAQDRDRWDRRQLACGAAILDEARRDGVMGPYMLQAAIAAEYARAPSYAETNWDRIVAFHDLLVGDGSNPVLRLNRAIVRMEQGRHDGALAEMDALRDELDRFGHWHAARAEVLQRMGRTRESATALDRAIDLTQNAALRAELSRRRDALATP